MFNKVTVFHINHSDSLSSSNPQRAKQNTVSTLRTRMKKHLILEVYNTYMIGVSAYSRSIITLICTQWKNMHKKLTEAHFANKLASCSKVSPWSQSHKQI
jgi:hypothetical protein